MPTFAAFCVPSSLRRFFFLPSISRGFAEISENLLMRAGGHENGLSVGFVGRAGRCVWFRTVESLELFWAEYFDVAYHFSGVVHCKRSGLKGSADRKALDRGARITSKLLADRLVDASFESNGGN